VRPIALSLLLIAACGPSAPPVVSTDTEREVKVAFEKWCASQVAGRVEEVYRGMSAQLISDWLYGRLCDAGDERMRRLRRDLAGQASDDLDVWFIANRSRNADRPTALPPSVLITPWLFSAFKLYYEPMKRQMKYEYERLEVVSVVVDSFGATVAVRNKAFGGTDRYMMVFEGEWKVDHHKEPDAQIPK
jgi:hypothetical protein